jgi:Tol biopolymer transport system component
MNQTLLPFALLAPLVPLALTGCNSLTCPIKSATKADQLIEKDEKHFAHLWQVTAGGQNAEGYWNFAGNRLSFQHTADNAKLGPTWACDRIFVTDPAGGPAVQVSDGKGVTTCAYFLPSGNEVLFASTRQWQNDCPPPPDRSKGYTWSMHPEYDIWIKNLDTNEERKLTDEWGYDAEATISPAGDRVVFTSSRSGDIELWTCDLNGGDLKQVTHETGYDGGAYFSHDGKKLVWRRTQFSPENQTKEEADYRELLSQWLVRPTKLELYVANADGSAKQQVTKLGGANWAPYFFVGDKRIIFASNYPAPKTPKFDLYAIDVDGENLEQITTYPGFDSFAMFSPDGRFLAFASNRGGSVEGETNLFVAQWK